MVKELEKPVVSTEKGQEQPLVVKPEAGLPTVEQTPNSKELTNDPGIRELQALREGQTGVAKIEPLTTDLIPGQSGEKGPSEDRIKAIKDVYKDGNGNPKEEEEEMYPVTKKKPVENV